MTQSRNCASPQKLLGERTNGGIVLRDEVVLAELDGEA